MDDQTRSKLIQEHLSEIARLHELQFESAHGSRDTWPPQGFYWLFHVVSGMTLGMIGASVSLLANVIGAVLVGEPPLKLIQVYLTFPMGERALQITTDPDKGMLYFVGCLLYLVTGGFYGILFQLVMTWYFRQAPLLKRLIVGSVLGLVLWIVNFYLILSWLQPVLLGGNWIVSEIPIVVGAGTHLLFAWTMVLVQTHGQFDRAAWRA
jgi:hypothetical protein